MGNKGLLTKILAAIGTLLTWLPILAPFILSGLALVSDGIPRFDWLMPAELFPLALAGAVLLLWAAVRARSRRKLIGGGIGAALVLLVGSQVLAVVTGLASGETEPAGWWWMVVLVTINGYSIALALIGVGGVLLLRDLFRTASTPPDSSHAVSSDLKA